ncbi:hypothetical protein [Verminephrobacter eiseniae]|uniref:hypothetical protein n=1 Tax=Verminephrobacter eiseniae TaxID=364317 RepID=UPI00031D2259|nr:hypothetical protein [Verminephrobacter eiseniae]KAB7591296.1 hypothetical protein ET532_014490 [Verminephrobacter sp. Larva24]MCW5230531.1 hypothetical protein [Verminephrobacter eiseniae]MCW5260287.1 hypothetical protein [Verminephrobacter eiseniae]MCW5285545.1 hypothetical protein [Verminephrobacter eiseniae]MCW5292263.1 hypothetical protein [Verminephrobacter eiseniae]
MRKKRPPARAARQQTGHRRPLHRGEFSILRERNPAACAAAGLSYDTQFNLQQAIDLPCGTEWFSVPPAAFHGPTPAC